MKKIRSIAFILIMSIIMNFTFIRYTSAYSSTISVGVYGDSGAMYESISVNYVQGDTAYSVLARCIGNIDATGSGDSIYVAGINGLYEFDGGPLSGWVYAVNGYKPNVSAGAYYLNPGDKLVWHFTVDLGNDIYLGVNKLENFIANNEVVNEPEAVPEVKPETKPEEVPEAKPEIIPENKPEHDANNNLNTGSNNSQSSNNDGENSSSDNVTNDTEAKKDNEKADGSEVEEDKKDQETSKKNDTESESEGNNVTDEKVKEIINLNISSFKKNTKSHWEALALVVNGDKNHSKFVNNIIEEMKDKEYRFSRVTDLEKNIILLNSAGYDVTDIDDGNILEILLKNENIEKQGSNGVIFAIIALNSINQDTVNEECIKSDGLTKEKLIEILLSYQNEDGGFPLNKGEKSITDLTSMALQALADNRGNEKVDKSIENAVNYLKNTAMQSSESISQAIIALSYLGIDCRDFNSNDLIEELFTYLKEDNRFGHTLEGSSDDMATEQAVLALTSYERYKSNEGGVYTNHDINKDEDVSTSKGNALIYLLAVIPVATIGLALIFYKKKKSK